MLIRVTNKCNMWCNHCFMEGLTKDEHHMTLETFKETLDFADRAGVVVLLISGGEPTLHPQILDLLDAALSYKDGDRFPIIITTNGTVFDDNPVLGRKLLKLAKPDGKVFLQVTNDARYYPRELKFDKTILDGTRSIFVDKIAGLYPCTRIAEQGLSPTVKTPSCFNLRSLTRTQGLNAAMQFLDLGMGRHCIPSVNIDGTLRAGEADWCHRIGKVTDPVHKVETSIRKMKGCNSCDRLHNLDRKHLRAIGEDRLVTLH